MATGVRTGFIGDGLPYSGFLRSFSIADMTNFEWPKLIGLVSFAILPSFAPFQDEPPFFSHRTIVKQIVAMLRAAKKQDKPTTFWLAYQAMWPMLNSPLS